MGTQVKIFIQKVRNTPTGELYEAIDNSTGNSFFIEAFSMAGAKRILDEQLRQIGLKRKQ